MYYLAVCLLPLERDAVQLVNDNDGNRVLLLLGVTLGLPLSGYLGRDL